MKFPKIRIVHTALMVGGATFPRLPPTTALPPRAATLVMLPSATRFLACAAEALGPPAPSAIAGRLAVADEDERREAPMVDIVCLGGGGGPLAESPSSG